MNGQTVFQYQKGKFASEKIILSRTSRDLKGGLEIKAKNGPLRMDNVWLSGACKCRKAPKQQQQHINWTGRWDFFSSSNSSFTLNYSHESCTNWSPQRMYLWPLMLLRDNVTPIKHQHNFTALTYNSLYLSSSVFWCTSNTQNETFFLLNMNISKSF